MDTIPGRLIPLLAALLLCHCGVPHPPQCRSVPRSSKAPAPVLLAEARRNWQVLANPSRQDEWPQARDAYNTAVAKLFDQLRCGTGGWDVRAAALGTRIPAADAKLADLSQLDALFPATLVNCKVVRNHRRTTGVGVPLVGWKATSPVGQPRPKFQLPNGLPYNLTATLAFDGTSAPVWHFDKRWVRDQVAIGRSSHTLAADWTAPNAFYWQMCDLDDLKIQNVILPDRFTEETGVYFVTPYDPKKIPIVFVHGLVSSPDAFKNMINELAPEPWFREKYQIWLYNYPTGNPWSYSAMKFRELMRETCAHARSKGGDANLNRMVVVAHSMGGLLSRSSVTDPGTVFYDAKYNKPPDQLQIPAETRAFIRDTALYQPLTEPERVVFLAVPHRGSPMANLKPAEWISRLIRLPKTLTVELLDSTLLAVGDVVQGEDPTQRLPTSINSLSPGNSDTRALDKLALPRDITFHSVIGDRGKGNTPQSSDGVVPYWSSHITPVASEKIVPCNHGVPDNSEAAEELKRILKLHLEDRR
jgi:triacylglycerol esterase/lipase EstA (alpha/beta hydrolase family)